MQSCRQEQKKPKKKACYEAGLCYRYARLSLCDGCAGAVGALAGFQAVQASSEAHLLRLLAERATAILTTAKHLNWLPDQPPRTALGHSAYIQDLLPFLKVCPHGRIGNCTVV